MPILALTFNDSALQGNRHNYSGQYQAGRARF